MLQQIRIFLNTHNYKYEFHESKTICCGYEPLGSNEIKEILDKILGSDTPIFIWSRDSLKETKNNEYLEAIKKFLSKVKNIHELPQLVREERINANNQNGQQEKHIGHNLCLLWDNPDRIPPDPQTPENALRAI
ncbi:MAG: hypothetical protein V7K92_21565 [Nostoc sp.]|uniref:VMAP-C domain-containing protein n=1 Tax=Nostoc sp. TaxID=1180 RepID=UPI002FF3BCFD